MPTRHQEGTSGSHGFEAPDRTCQICVRMALHDLKVSEHKIVHAYKVSGGGAARFHGFVHAYKVSGRGCRISRVRNIRS